MISALFIMLFGAAQLTAPSSGLSASTKLSSPAVTATRPRVPAALTVSTRSSTPAAAAVRPRTPAALAMPLSLSPPVALAAHGVAPGALRSATLLTPVTFAAQRSAAPASLRSVPVLTAVVATIQRPATPAGLVVAMRLPVAAASVGRHAVPSPLAAAMALAAGSPTAVFGTPLVRSDRVLTLSAADGRTVFLGGIGGAAWYRVHRLGLWTIDLDPAALVMLRIDWAGMFAGPVTVTTSVTSEDGALAGSVVVADATGVTFRVGGGGGTMRFTVTHGGVGEVDFVAVRVRSRVVA